MPVTECLEPVTDYAGIPDLRRKRSLRQAGPFFNLPVQTPQVCSFISRHVPLGQHQPAFSVAVPHGIPTALPGGLACEFS